VVVELHESKGVEVMAAKTIIAIAIAVVTAAPVHAQTIRGARGAAFWDNPPGSAFQDRGNIEDMGNQPVLTPRGYRAARPYYYGSPYGFARTPSRFQRFY